MIYFTSDTHGNHTNMLEYADRPYKDILEMRKDFIKRWNSVVTEKDEVYILGDLWMGHDGASTNTLHSFLNKVKGTKHLILGNHDEMKPYTYLNLGIRSVHTSLWLEEFFLCHDRMRSLVFTKNHTVLCGHVHNYFKYHKNCVNVGVDVWNYTPVSIDEIRELVKEKLSD